MVDVADASRNSVLKEESEESLSNRDAIVVVPETAHGILVDNVGEDTLAVPRIQDLFDDVFGELGMALHSNELVLNVHPLVVADWRVAEFLDGGRITVDDVLVHLIQAL